MAQSDSRFLVLGLQRTGTNLAGYYVGRMFPQHQHAYPNKHVYPDDSVIAGLRTVKKLHIALIARHPVLWIESLLQNAPHNFYTMHQQYLSEIPDQVAALGEFYNRYHELWLNPGNKVDITSFLYEDILRDDGDSFGAWLQERAGVAAEMPSLPAKLRESTFFSAEDRQKALDFRTNLPHAIVDCIMTKQSFVAEKMGYSKEQLTITGPASPRTFLYDFVRGSVQTARRDPDAALRAAAAHPGSPIANLAADIATRDKAGYRGEYLERMKNAAVSAMTDSSMSGAEVFALINLALQASRPAEATYMLAVYERENLNIGQLLLLKVKIAEAQGDLQDVERTLRAGLELTSDSIELGITLAHFLLNTDRAPEALQVLDRLHATHDREPWILGTRALVLSHMVRLEEAERDIKRALKLQQDFGNLEVSTVGGYTILLASILLQAGKAGEASELLDKLTDYPRTDWFEAEIARIRNGVKEHQEQSRKKTEVTGKSQQETGRPRAQAGEASAEKATRVAPPPKKTERHATRHPNPTDKTKSAKDGGTE